MRSRLISIFSEGNVAAVDEEMRKEQRKKDKELHGKWLKWLTEESAKTFTPK